MYYSIALGAVVVAGLVSTLGGLVYLAWNLSWPAVIVVLALTAVASFFVLRFVFSQPREHDPLRTETSLHFPEVEPRGKSALWFLGLIPFACLIVVGILTLVRHQTDVSLNTPWQEVPQIFWLSLTLAALGGAALLVRAKNSLAWMVTLGLLAAGVSVAAIIYRLGYGYDPFVHQAAEQHILDFGFIAPKTPYYAGQYALAVIVARLSGVAIHSIDVWLLPTLAILGISSAIGVAARAAKANTGAWSAALLALLPLAPFIDTTPFGLASLYCLLAGMVGLGTKQNPRLKLVVWIFALAAVLTHPIAGVPAMVLALIIQFKKSYLRVATAIVAAAVLPVLFAISSKGFSFSWDRIGTISLPFELPLTRFHALGDPLYALGAAAAIVIIVGATTNYSYLLAAGSAALSGVLVAVSIDFSYLPDSEQGGYAARLLTVALLIAAPAAIAASAKLLEKTAGKPWRFITAVAAVAFFFVGGVYLAYPRTDAYVISKGWNTSTTDISVVHAIASDAGGEPYIVLAAQPVSAAALKEFGFFRYFDTKDGQVFAYPVPTGGPLYQYYLKMIYDEPSAEYMKQAMELAGVKRGYLVVNSYWTRADHIINRAQQTSEKWFGIDNADFVFRYSR